MAKNKGQIIKELKSRAMLEYGLPLRKFKVIGEGMTSIVIDIPGKGQVLKVMDTRCGTADLLGRRQMWEYFVNEIDSLRQLSESSHIIRMLDSYEYVFPEERRLPLNERNFRSLFFVRMPKLVPLERYLRSRATEQTLIRVAMDICLALQDCERHDILHRDVKPMNIFVENADAPEEEVRFILGDFGLSRRTSRLSHSVVSVCGTPAFMAPEIACSQPRQGFNADVYSLGCTIFFLLSRGNFPRDYYLDDAQPLPDISPGFAAIIRKAVDPNPKTRFASAGEMYASLSRISGNGIKSVVSRHYFLQAKQEILREDYEAAITSASEGWMAGELECKRLLAYCLYHEHKDDPERVSQARQLLDELIVCEQDPIAQYIRAIIHYNEGEPADYAQNLRESAEAGYVIAQSTYGRFLYDGRVPEIGCDRKRGCDFLIRAAQSGYLPALRFLKRISPRDCPPLPPGLQRCLSDPKLAHYEDYVREDIVKFL